MRYQYQCHERKGQLFIDDLNIWYYMILYMKRYNSSLPGRDCPPVIACLDWVLQGTLVTAYVGRPAAVCALRWFPIVWFIVPRMRLILNIHGWNEGNIQNTGHTNVFLFVGIRHHFPTIAKSSRRQKHTCFFCRLPAAAAAPMFYVATPTSGPLTAAVCPTCWMSRRATLSRRACAHHERWSHKPWCLTHETIKLVASRRLSHETLKSSCCSTSHTQNCYALSTQSNMSYHTSHHKLWYIVNIMWYDTCNIRITFLSHINHVSYHVVFKCDTANA